MRHAWALVAGGAATATRNRVGEAARGGPKANHAGVYGRRESISKTREKERLPHSVVFPDAGLRSSRVASLSWTLVLVRAPLGTAALWPRGATRRTLPAVHTLPQMTARDAHVPESFS